MTGVVRPSGSVENIAVKFLRSAYMALRFSCGLRPRLEASSVGCGVCLTDNRFARVAPPLHNACKEVVQ